MVTAAKIMAAFTFMSDMMVQVDMSVDAEMIYLRALDLSRILYWHSGYSIGIPDTLLAFRILYWILYWHSGYSIAVLSLFIIRKTFHLQSRKSCNAVDALLNTSQLQSHSELLHDC